MALKWDRKTAIECITTMTSPFEKLGMKSNNGTGTNLGNILKILRKGK